MVAVPSKAWASSHSAQSTDSESGLVKPPLHGLFGGMFVMETTGSLDLEELLG
jgi:hypothetical protein